MTPASANMNCHISAATTVGMAQGRSTVARRAPRPRITWCRASASTIPRMTSAETAMVANRALCPSAAQKRLLVRRSW